MKIVKSILCAIGLTFLTNISLVSIFPLILLVIFLALYSKIEIIKDKKVYVLSSVISLLYFIIFLRTEFILSFKYIVILVSLYLIFELLISYFHERVGNNNV